MQPSDVATELEEKRQVGSDVDALDEADRSTLSLDSSIVMSLVELLSLLGVEGELESLVAFGVLSQFSVSIAAQCCNGCDGSQCLNHFHS